MNKPRLNAWAVAPKLMNAMVEYSTSVVEAGLEPSLVELVKIRASQLNGCAVCLHMHTREARQKGETEERIFLLDAWRETPFYSARERAALAWTEVLTRMDDSEAAYEAVRAEFSEEDQVKLTLMITVINSWNRIGVGFRQGPVVK